MSGAADDARAAARRGRDSPVACYICRAGIPVPPGTTPAQTWSRHLAQKHPGGTA